MRDLESTHKHYSNNTIFLFRPGQNEFVVGTSNPTPPPGWWVKNGILK
jgi:hypothetical protein